MRRKQANAPETAARLVNAPKRQRLDQLLVALELAPTRSKARDLILGGHVRIAGKAATKPAALVAADEAVSVEPHARSRVSRSAAKLEAALDAFGFSPEGRTALDLGASTGGFTQVLLERGAARVYAVDVGHGQLDESLAKDNRVMSLEGQDARDLDDGIIAEPIEALVADLSFISLTIALPAVLALAAPGTWLVALIKPQFELDRKTVGKGGIVRDEEARQRAVEKVRNWFADQPGWRIEGVIPAPIEGAGGNQEYLIGAERVG